LIRDLPTVFKASRREPPGISSIMIRMYSPGVYWILEEFSKTLRSGLGDLSALTGQVSPPQNLDRLLDRFS
jgi:hypothetical protein